MIFNSVTYIVFLALVVTLYWLLPHRIGKAMLFVSSLLFYGFWRFEFIPLLLLAAVIDYWCSLKIDNSDVPVVKKRYLIFSLIVNLGILFYFKYLVFFASNLSWALNVFGVDIHIPHLDIILPLGISFYTFETISYTLDVYRGHIRAEKNFLSYATFLVYFPHLIAGPVLRAADILPQLRLKRKFELNFIAEGIKRILQGLFLKVVLADNISPLVDAGFALPLKDIGALDVFTLAFLFGLQIYFDFSAYSHIAIGSAKMMGIEFPENFNFPYIASSFKSFWKRWHISLSSWIRDYLYLPIMKARVSNDTSIGIGNSLNDNTGKRNRNVALFLTWAIMGLWHGANWTFIFWGVYHAAFIFLERLIHKRIPGISSRFSNVGGWFVTIPVVMLGWIPFRAANMHIVSEMFLKLFSFSQYTFLGMSENTYIISALLFLLMLLMYSLRGAMSVSDAQPSPAIGKTILRVAVYVFIIICVFTFLRPISQFIYFQF